MRKPRGCNLMSPTEDRNVPALDRVKAFTTEGLANARISSAKLDLALQGDQPLTWKFGRQRTPVTPRAEQIEKYLATAVTGDGPRLVAPVGLKGMGLVESILGLPGYQASADDTARQAFKSF